MSSRSKQDLLGRLCDVAVCREAGQPPCAPTGRSRHASLESPCRSARRCETAVRVGARRRFPLLATRLRLPRLLWSRNAGVAAQRAQPAQVLDGSDEGAVAPTARIVLTVVLRAPEVHLQHHGDTVRAPMRLFAMIMGRRSGTPSLSLLSSCRMETAPCRRGPPLACTILTWANHSPPPAPLQRGTPRAAPDLHASSLSQRRRAPLCGESLSTVLVAA